MFSGPTTKCLPWFSSLGFEPELDVNPLDFLIDISSLDIIEEDKREVTQARVERLLLAWKTGGIEFTKAPLPQASKTPVDEVFPLDIQEKISSGSSTKHPLQPPGFLAQTFILTSR